MDLELSKKQFDSTKESFLNIYALLIKRKAITKENLDCIFKWGAQLDIPREELNFILNNPDSIEFDRPKTKIEAVEQIYDLVYMIYLDGLVEDIELEVAMTYAEKLGFQRGIVGDLLKAIDSAPGDGIPREKVKEELKELLESSL
ncbi:MAG: hypothetical protein AAF363_00460 [Bacteroidota bacterium]